MKFGLQVNPYFPGNSGNPWDQVLEASRVVDASALDSLWAYDHFLYEGGYSAHPIPEPVMECFTILGAMAAVTERVRLGQLVLGVPYRNPAMTAKMATTLDLISHGRSILGLGAGWHKREHEAYGWGDFEEAPVRLQRLEEALQVTLALWTQRPSKFEGRYYRLQELIDNPSPLQQPHPPILIGGSGEKVTLRLVAQYAQWCNVMGGPADVERLFGILRDHCERLRRPYEEITRSIYVTVLVGRNEGEVGRKREKLAEFLPARGTLVGTSAQLVDMFGEYATAGCQHVIFRTPDWNDLDPIHQISEDVVPALANA